jgi:hypothetical protein
MTRWLAVAILAALAAGAVSCQPLEPKRMTIGACATCGGTGTFGARTCPTCKGLGYVHVEYSYPVPDPYR